MACCSGCSGPRPGSAAATAEETPPKEVGTPDECNKANSSSALESDEGSSPEDISVPDGYQALLQVESLPKTACQPGLEPTSISSTQKLPATRGNGCCGKAAQDGKSLEPPPCCEGKPFPCCDVSCLDRLALRECRDKEPQLDPHATSESKNSLPSSTRLGRELTVGPRFMRWKH